MVSLKQWTLGEYDDLRSIVSMLGLQYYPGVGTMNLETPSIIVKTCGRRQ